MGVQEAAQPRPHRHRPGRVEVVPVSVATQVALPLANPRAAQGAVRPAAEDLERVKVVDVLVRCRVCGERRVGSLPIVLLQLVFYALFSPCECAQRGSIVARRPRVGESEPAGGAASSLPWLPCCPTSSLLPAPPRPDPDYTDDVFSTLSQLQINLLLFYALIAQIDFDAVSPASSGPIDAMMVAATSAIVVLGVGLSAWLEVEEVL